MPQVSKNLKSNLVCITGVPGSGKTYAMNFFKSKGFDTFITDQWVHWFYQKNNLGYFLIEKNFGANFLNDTEVDRKKLLNYVLKNSQALVKLNNLMFEQIYQKLERLKAKKHLIFVELGIYLIEPLRFCDLFQQVVVIDCRKNSFKKNPMKKFYKSLKFSTKPVGNFKNCSKNPIILVDKIVENFQDLPTFEKNLKIFLKDF